jgi:hypothetical protein
MTVQEAKVEGRPPSPEDKEEVRRPSVLKKPNKFWRLKNIFKSIFVKVRRRIRECGEVFNPADVQEFVNDDICFNR